MTPVEPVSLSSGSDETLLSLLAHMHTAISSLLPRDRPTTSLADSSSARRNSPEITPSASLHQFNDTSGTHTTVLGKRQRSSPSAQGSGRGQAEVTVVQDFRDSVAKLRRSISLFSEEASLRNTFVDGRGGVGSSSAVLDKFASLMKERSIHESALLPIAHLIGEGRGQRSEGTESTEGWEEMSRVAALGDASPGGRAAVGALPWVAGVIGRRSKYDQPFIDPNTPFSLLSLSSIGDDSSGTDALDSIASSLEGVARSLGMETFRDQGAQKQTLMLGCKILVVDIDLEQAQEKTVGHPPPAAVVKLKISYALPSASTSNGSNSPPRDSRLDALLLKDVRQFANLVFDVEALGSPAVTEQDSRALRASRHLSRFARNLAFLVKLDELTANSMARSLAPSTTNSSDAHTARTDWFAALESFTTSVEAVLQQEQDAIAAEQVDPRAQDRQRLLRGHGLSTSFEETPYLSITYCDNMAVSSEVVSRAGRYSLWVDVEEVATEDEVDGRVTTNEKPEPEAVPTFSLLSEENRSKVGDAVKSASAPNGAMTFIAHLSPPIVVPKGIARSLAQVVRPSNLNVSGSEQLATGSAAMDKKSWKNAEVPRVIADMKRQPSSRFTGLGVPRTEGGSWIEMLLMDGNQGLQEGSVSVETEHGYRVTLSSPPALLRTAPAAGFLIERLPFRDASQLFRIIEILKQQVLANELLTGVLRRPMQSNKVVAEPDGGSTSDDEKDLTLTALLAGTGSGDRESNPSATVSVSLPPLSTSHQPATVVHLSTPLSSDARSLPYTVNLSVAPNEAAPSGWSVGIDLRDPTGKLHASTKEKTVNDACTSSESEAATIMGTGAGLEDLLGWVRKRGWGVGDPFTGVVQQESADVKTEDVDMEEAGEARHWEEAINEGAGAPLLNVDLAPTVPVSAPATEDSKARTSVTRRRSSRNPSLSSGVESPTEAFDGASSALRSRRRGSGRSAEENDSGGGVGRSISPDEMRKKSARRRR